MHDGEIISIAFWTAGASLTVALALFVVKVAHWRLTRSAGVRRARYTGAIGEILARGIIPRASVVGWARDPIFEDVLLEYISIAAGDERENLEELVRHLDIRTILVNNLRGSWRASKRLRAAGYLADLADHGQEWALIEALDDPIPEIRIQAARGLATLRSAGAIPKLVQMLTHEETWYAARIADQLVTYGTAATDELVAYAEQTTDPSGRELAVRLIGSIGDRSASPVLVRLCNDPDPGLRLAAVSALGKSGTLEAVPVLISALADEDWRVRARAAASLGPFSDPHSIHRLENALRDDSWWVRQNAAEALVEIPGGRDALISAVGGADPYARDSALLQLGLAGEIEDARARMEEGKGSDADERLIRAVDGEPPRRSRQAS